MAKRPRSEQQFGSDSFLDVICNLVGIIVVLIVISGLKVSQDARRQQQALTASPITLGPADSFPGAPPALLTNDETAVALTLPTEGQNPEPLPFSEPARLPEPDQLTELIPPAQPQPTQPPELVLPTELMHAATQYESTIASSKDRLNALNDQLSRGYTAIAKLEKQLATLQSQEQQANGQIEQRRAAAAETAAQAEALRKELSRLATQVQVVESEGPPVQTLEHRITPISRVVEGAERHFRVSQGRVAEVPIDALVERLKSQVERRKDWISKMQQHQGEVGPIGGFRMYFVVQRETPGVLDEIRMGSGLYKIVVSQWRVEPEPDLFAETAEQAVAPSGRFYRSVLDAPADSALTFWVYPDSFSAFATLKAFSHEHGFTVAGRPLPPGTPIAGSPQGSRSAGQ